MLFGRYFGPANQEEAMPYPAGHRNEVRKNIVKSARRLFNRHGFDRVSLKQIMAGAGLTHGGFYSYFASKSELYVEVLGCFFTDPEWKNCWEGVEVDLAAGDVGPQVVRAYLSRQHFEDVENSCPMTALPTDVAQHCQYKTCIRNSLSCHGECPRAQHSQKWRTAATLRPGHRRFVRGRNGGSSSFSRSRACG
jgi:hypothetical protein